MYSARDAYVKLWALKVIVLLQCRTGGLKGCTVRNATGELPDTQVIAICAVLPLASFEELCFAGLSLVRCPLHKGPFILKVCLQRPTSPDGFKKHSTITVELC